MNKLFNINVSFKNFIKILLILLIPYMNLILDFNLIKINYIELGTLSFYLPYFYIYARIYFFPNIYNLSR